MNESSDCQCCGEKETEENKIGLLSMPKRRAFRICQLCVQEMWRVRGWAKDFDIMEG
jgi:hypothetical protein